MRAAIRVSVLPVVFAILLPLVSVGPAAGQKLPAGQEHRHRERTYDLQHLKAELSFDLAAGRVDGRAAIRLEPLADLETVTLDAIGLEISSLSRDGEELEFTDGDGKLEVDLGSATAGEPLTLEIDYRARPRAGMYFQRDRQNGERTFVHTYGEGGLHANWLPLYAGVNDKFTSEMVVTVPKPYAVVSNGRLVATTEAGETVTYHWSQERPHPAYLISIYVGDFERGELEPAFGDIPLAYWVPQGRLAEGAYAFRNTTAMVEFFSDRFDYRYPWVKYDQIAVPDYAVGAMEHTGVTGHDENVLRLEGAPESFGPDFSRYGASWTAETLIAHELAHHWFGDDLTCRNLSYIWLNESFASYLMFLWNEELLGRDRLLFDVERARRSYFDYVAAEHTIRPLEYRFFDAPDDIYNEEHTYLKGAAVLHMLRTILGDEAYFGALGDYLDRHQLGNVVSDDLLIAIEESTGRNLDWFFADWITGGGHPVFEVAYRYRAERGVVDLEIEQVQPLVEGQGLFKLPVTVKIAAADGIREERIWVEKATEKVLLPSIEKPLWVSFDGDGDLVAEIRFDKGPAELAGQARGDGLPGRMRALGQLARRFPSHPQTIEVFSEVLSGDGFWALRAEAAELLGEIRTRAAARLAEHALGASDYRVRKAAVLAGARMGPEAAVRLRRVVEEDPASDVVGTAIVALATADPAVDGAFLAAQLGRESWYDEITVAVLRAMTVLERPELAATVKPYAGSSWNQAVRQAAFEAWEASAPDDPELHSSLLAAAQESPYPVQKLAIEMLGRLAVGDAVPVLEELAAGGFDPNLTKRATEALAEIRRVGGAG